MDIPHNNAGNLKWDGVSNWLGMQQPVAKGDIITFDKLSDSYRAMIKDFQTNIGEGNDTIESIVTKYAPPEENDTESYITYISDGTGIDAQEPLQADDIQTLGNIAYHMSMLEHGTHGDDGTLEDALNEAEALFQTVVDDTDDVIDETAKKVEDTVKKAVTTAATVAKKKSVSYHFGDRIISRHYLSHSN